MRKYNVSNPYEKLKELTRGKQVDSDSITQFIHSLHEIPDDVRNQLLALTPSSYIGYAAELANQI